MKPKTDVSDETQLALLTKGMADMTQAFREMKEEFKAFRAEFVTKVEFAPVKALVYGLTGLILTLVIGALVYTVINK